MLLEFYLIGFFFAVILLWVANSQESFGYAYLAVFTFFILGLAIMSSGIDINSGSHVTTLTNGDTMTATSANSYSNYTMNDNWIVNLLGNTFFYLPIAGFFLTIFYALKN